MSGAMANFVQAGACIDSSNHHFYNCALKPDDCDSIDHFRNPHQLKYSRIPLPTGALDCLAQAAVKRVSVGRCVTSGTEKSYCSGTDLSCPKNNENALVSHFLPNHDQCTVVANTKPTEVGYSVYAFCSVAEGTTGDDTRQDTDGGYCVWSSADCATETASFNPSVGIDTISRCTCDKVRTGACIFHADPSQKFCAVAEDSCDTQHTGYHFVSVRELESLNSSRNPCYLCDSLPLPSELDQYVAVYNDPPLPSVFTLTPTQAINLADGSSPVSSLGQSRQTNGRNKLVYSLTGMILVACFVLGTFLIIRKQRIGRSRREAQKKNSTEDVVSEDLPSVA